MGQPAATERCCLPALRHAFTLDCIVGFQNRDEAEQLLSELRERCHRFHLALHPEKTRLIACGRYARARRQRRGQGKPETFDVLSLTHMCGTTKRGKCTVRRCTIATRLRKQLQEVKQDPARA